jgi:hypothetical protein
VLSSRLHRSAPLPFRCRSRWAYVSSSFTPSLVFFRARLTPSFLHILLDSMEESLGSVPYLPSPLRTLPRSSLLLSLPSSSPRCRSPTPITGTTELPPKLLRPSTTRTRTSPAREVPSPSPSPLPRPSVSTSCFCLWVGEMTVSASSSCRPLYALLDADAGSFVFG